MGVCQSKQEKTLNTVFFFITEALPKAVMGIDEPGVDYYENQHLTKFSILNIFQKDVLDIFKENNVEISEISNVDIIKYKKC